MSAVSCVKCVAVQHNTLPLVLETFKICHKTSNCKQCPASFRDTQPGKFWKGVLILISRPPRC